MSSFGLTRTLRRGALTSLLVGATTCAPSVPVHPAPLPLPVDVAVTLTSEPVPAAATPPAPQRRDRFIYLVTIDGVRWQDVFPCDHTPNLCRFGQQGAFIGRDGHFQASGPNCVSLPGYLEITRGHPSTDCPDNYCRPTHVVPSIVDGFTTVVAFSGWTPINLTLPEGTPGRRGVPTDPWGYRVDAETFDNALRWLRSPAAAAGTTRLMWLSFGDTDEYAHAGSRSGYLKALERADSCVDRLVREHASLFPSVDADFIVTADHGRSDADWRRHGGDPTSCRDWLVAFGDHVAPVGHSAQGGTLSDVRATVRHLAFGDDGGLVK